MNKSFSFSFKYRPTHTSILYYTRYTSHNINILHIHAHHYMLHVYISQTRLLNVNIHTFLHFFRLLSFCMRPLDGKMIWLHLYLLHFLLFFFLLILFLYFTSYICRYAHLKPLVVIYEHEPVNPCVPNPCGANALCNERNGVGSCSCMKDYFGDPYLGCRPECVQNSDCPYDKACFNMRCENPCACIGTCDANAECSVINHAPVCHCNAGYTGDAFQNCYPIPDNSKQIRLPSRTSLTSNTNRNDFPTFLLRLRSSNQKAYLPLPPDNPCVPSPCGAYSDCHVIQGHPVCSCLAQYFGSPPHCRPECTVSSECPADRSCINQQCVDPCPGVCGINAMCRAVNHNPICSCMYGFVGDPFVQCVQPSKSSSSSSSSSLSLDLVIYRFSFALQLNRSARNQSIHVFRLRAVRIHCVA